MVDEGDDETITLTEGSFKTETHRHAGRKDGHQSIHKLKVLCIDIDRGKGASNSGLIARTKPGVC